MYDEWLIWFNKTLSYDENLVQITFNFQCILCLLHISYRMDYRFATVRYLTVYPEHTDTSGPECPSNGYAISQKQITWSLHVCDVTYAEPRQLP